MQQQQQQQNELSSMTTILSWPPPSLALGDVDAIIDECELMEIHPERGAGKQFIPVRTHPFL
jgi:hypothetical protein